jgi:hypothetical protein
MCSPQLITSSSSGFTLFCRQCLSPVQSIILSRRVNLWKPVVHHLFDGIGNTLRGGERVSVVKVGIAKCRRYLGMAQQPPDHRYRLGPLDGVAGERVADVMDAKAHDAGAFLDLVPVNADGLDLLAHLPIPEQPFDFWMSSQRRMIDHRASLGAKPDGAAPGL